MRSAESFHYLKMDDSMEESVFDAGASSDFEPEVVKPVSITQVTVRVTAQVTAR